jgi:predicted TIM-barrel fold metal-dependent hydrolase
VRRPPPGPEPLLIDVHHHAIPATYLARLADIGVDAPVQGATFPKWDPESSLEMMNRAGIELAILSVSSPGLAGLTGTDAIQLARSVNEYLCSLTRQFPDRFGAFALVPVDNSDVAIREITYAMDELQLDGVGLYTSSRGVYLGDLGTEPFLEHLAVRDIPTFLHPVLPPGLPPMFGVPGSVIEFPIETTRALTSLLFSGTLDRHPGLKLIVSHAGGAVPFLAARMAHAATIDPGLDGRPPLDLRGSLRRLYYDVAMSATPAQLACLLDLADEQAVLFGSDYPFMPAAHGVANAEGLRGYPGLTRDAPKNVSRDNAARLFPRVRRMAAPS